MNFTWKLSNMEQRQDDYIMGPEGQMEMKCIYYISTWTNVTQVSDVAHGPLVYQGSTTQMINCDWLLVNLSLAFTI
jgi:hypothetical protein